VRAHDRVRADPYRLQVGLVGLEAMLRLFTDEERNERAFLALTRFLDALDDAVVPGPGRRPALDPLVLSFQLKLLWLSGYLPHLESCVECGRRDGLVAFVPAAGGVACADCDRDGIPLDAEAANGIDRLVRTPIAGGRELGLGERACRGAHAVITASYEHHGGFRLKTASW
jgi:DNA repair protein RecO (recombination protein O)